MDRGLPRLVHRVVVLMGKANRLPPQLQVWVDARRRFGLSHAQVAMARELGLNPASSVSWATIGRSRGRRRW